MTRKDLKAYYIRCDCERTVREPEFRSDLYRIRQRLGNALRSDVIFMKCFNDVDVEIIKDGLTEEQLKQVRFSWLYTIPEDQAA